MFGRKRVGRPANQFHEGLGKIEKVKLIGDCGNIGQTKIPQGQVIDGGHGKILSR